jgi:hypothetical protein
MHSQQQSYSDLTSILSHKKIFDCNTFSSVYCLNNEMLYYFSDVWDYNRSPDHYKIKSISRHLENYSNAPTMLFFFLKNDKLYCYDGNHRREALIQLFKEGYSYEVMCNVITDPYITNEMIGNEFLKINMSTPLPDIALDIVGNLDNAEKLDELMTQNDIIEQLLLEYKQSCEYKPFYSLNAKPHKTRFNDTTFKNLCSSLTFSSVEQLKHKLKELNSINRNRVETATKKKDMLTASQYQKCKIANFYLFA